MYIFFFKERNYIANWIIMIRISGEHLRTTYGNTGLLFRPVVYTLISPTGDQTSDHRILSQNSTMKPPIYITRKRRQIN